MATPPISTSTVFRHGTGGEGNILQPPALVVFAATVYKTFGPTDLTSKYSVCIRRCFDMLHFFMVFLINVFFLRLPATKAYVAREQLNTDDGYCDSCTYGRVPIGESDFNDEQCERYDCSEGFLNIIGCGVVLKPTFQDRPNPICRLVKGGGHYPDCCPNYKCDFNEKE
ncbi:SVWC domain-containing protein [Trichonephila clavipes]|nr:SVWC domain-containing protein [Trichonephila clavipes]